MIQKPKPKMTIAEVLKWIKPEFVENEERIEENKKKKRRRYYQRKKAKKEPLSEKDWEEKRAIARFRNTREGCRVFAKKKVVPVVIAGLLKTNTNQV